MSQACEYGLFSCLDSPGDCCYVLCCAPCAVGTVAEKTGGDKCQACLVICCCPVLYSCCAPCAVGTVAEKTGGDKCQACLVICCCPVLYSCCVTKPFKENQGIEYNCLTDFFIAQCCMCCEITKESNTTA